MRAVLLFTLLAYAVPAFAVPQRLSYQGYLTDTTDAPLTGTVNVTFTLFNAPTSGQAVWTETLSVDVQDGYLSVVLGTQTPFAPALITGASLHLEIQIENDTPMSPRLEITSVPFALRAGVADDVQGDINPSSVSVSGQVVIDNTGAWVGSTSGLQGPQGPAGAACWDTNADGSCDVATEDKNASGGCEVADCTSGDTLGGLSCSLGDVPRFMSDAWVCSPITDNDTLASLPCNEGDMAVLMGGVWTCQAVSSGVAYSPGTGLAIDVGNAFHVLFPVSGGESGVLDEAARSDHTHDSAYASFSALATNDGVINEGDDLVDWTQLRNVPPDLADGSDDSNVYNAGTGLTLNAGSFDVDFATPGQGAVGSQVWAADYLQTDDTIPNEPNDPVHWSKLHGIPAAVTAPDNDLLASLICLGTNEVLFWNGSDWVCTTNTIATLSCNAGEQPLWDGSLWSCIATPSSGAGLKLTAGEFSLDFATIGSVAIANQSWPADFLQSTDGTPNEPNDPVHWSKLRGIPTPIADGDGDLLATLSCPGTSEVLFWNGSTWTCTSDTLATVSCLTNEQPMWNGTNWVCILAPTNGAGLNFSAGVFSVAYAAANSAAAPNQSWPADFLQGNDGTPNQTNDPLNWTKLRDIPPSLVDGDNDLLGTIPCNDGETVRRVGGAWVCAPAVPPLQCNDQLNSSGGVGGTTTVTATAPAGLAITSGGCQVLSGTCTLSDSYISNFATNQYTCVYECSGTNTVQARAVGCRLTP